MYVCAVHVYVHGMCVFTCLLCTLCEDVYTCVQARVWLLRADAMCFFYNTLYCSEAICLV